MSNIRMAKSVFSRYSKQFFRLGGFRLIRALSRIGILSIIAKNCWKGLANRKTIDEIYSSVQPIIISALRKKYSNLVQESIKLHRNTVPQSECSDYVWFCWLQGIDNAPVIVKSCYESLNRNIKGKEIRFINNDNRKEYIQLPDFIERRWKKGQITLMQNLFQHALLRK